MNNEISFLSSRCTVDRAEKALLREKARAKSRNVTEPEWNSLSENSLEFVTHLYSGVVAQFCV